MNGRKDLQLGGFGDAVDRPKLKIKEILGHVDLALEVRNPISEDLNLKHFSRFQRWHQIPYSILNPLL